MINPQATYAPSQYLVAVGEGDTRRAAENSATAGLARIFESQIQASETFSETVTETAELLDRISELQTDVQIGTEQKLLNVQFGEAFTDSSGRVHVAALLPRAETAQIYRQRISENSGAVIHLIRKSDQAPGAVDAYAFRRAAVRKALENDRLLAQLDIIAPHSRPALPYAPPALYSEAAAAAQKVTFSVSLTGDAGDALREALTGLGFSESSHAALLFSGAASVKNTDIQRNNLAFVRWQYSIEARDRAGSLLFSFSGSQREGHINVEQATLRARRSLRSEILKSVPRETGNFLDRLASAGLQERLR